MSQEFTVWLDRKRNRIKNFVSAFVNNNNFCWMSGVLDVTASRHYCSQGFRSFAAFVRVVYVHAALSLRRGC